MTKDREFKRHVRDRAGKTGQSYQATRRAMSEPTAGRPSAPSAEAEIRAMFQIPGGRQAAGCMILSGEVRCWDHAEVIRGGIVVGAGTVSSIRTYLRQVSAVRAGQECGIVLIDVDDLRVGDRLVVEATGQAKATEERLLEAVLESTSAVSGQGKDVLVGPSRTRLATLARQEAMYIANYVGLEPSVIAEAFGRPPRTVHHAVEKVDALRENEPNLQGQLTDILRRLSDRLTQAG